MSECDVCIGVDDYDDVAEFWQVENRRARKSHKCCECNGEIKPREEYEHVRGKFDGVMFACDTCDLCREIRNVFSCGEMSPVYETLWDSMRDAAFPVLTTASKCFTELSPAAKAFVLERWREWKGLKGAAER
jgi:hypothetical protein